MGYHGAVRRRQVLSVGLYRRVMMAPSSRASWMIHAFAAMGAHSVRYVAALAATAACTELGTPVL